MDNFSVNNIPEELTIAQYLYLYFLVNNNSKEAINILDKETNDDMSENDLFFGNLEENMYITESRILTDKSIKLFLNDYDVLFNELLLVFPKQTIKNRKLQLNITTCKEIYRTIVNNGELIIHNNIIKALKAEIRIRQLNGDLEYMKTLYNWLIEETWKAYELDSDIKTKINNYKML